MKTKVSRYFVSAAVGLFLMFQGVLASAATLAQDFRFTGNVLTGRILLTAIIQFDDSGLGTGREFRPISSIKVSFSSLDPANPNNPPQPIAVFTGLQVRNPNNCPVNAEFLDGVYRRFGTFDLGGAACRGVIPDVAFFPGSGTWNTVFFSFGGSGGSGQLSFAGPNAPRANFGALGPPRLTNAIGDFVWEDRDADGIQAADEPGIADVAVNLLDSGDNFIRATTTGGSGFYLFDDLVADDYRVEFVAPLGFEFSPQDQGSDDTVDSDANVSTGKTETITLMPGEGNLTVDAGMINKFFTGPTDPDGEQVRAINPISLVPPTQVIGDLVWEDRDGDGIQADAASEPGISGVTVNLLYASDNDMVMTTTTDTNGHYLFENVVPFVEHKVEFVVPSGFVFSPQEQGSDDRFDSDANVSTGKTEAITLMPGEVNLTVDAGLVPEISDGIIPGDIDGDSDVDRDDLGIVVSCFGQTAPLTPPCDAADVAPPPDGDGVVNILDISFVGSNFTP